MKLSKFLKSSGITKHSLAKSLGVTITAIDHWVSERRFPRLKYLKKIKKITGGKVTANDFYDIKTTKSFFNLF